MGGAAHQCAQVQPVLQQLEFVRVHINNRNVVGFANQRFRYGRANLPGTEDDDIQLRPFQ
jgi:hypothetical protein